MTNKLLVVIAVELSEALVILVDVKLGIVDVSLYILAALINPGTCKLVIFKFGIVAVVT